MIPLANHTDEGALLEMSVDAQFSGITLRRPNVEDGAALHHLIRECGTLDENSVYCNVLQCAHFADTCIVAEKDGRLVGFVTGYVKPAEPHIFFLWQVGVSEAGRGAGLAKKMIQAILAREFCGGVTELNTTITKTNEASRALFASFARDEGAEMTEHEWLTEALLDGHNAEYLFRISPLSTPRR
jgi:L-2,4-diaminobutyric acid acetyltransferase